MATQNPYPGFETLFPMYLQDIATINPTNINELVIAASNIIRTYYYPGSSQQINIELTSIAYNAINSYQNNLVLSGKAAFNIRQVPFIQLLIGSSMTGNSIAQPDSLAAIIADIEDNIGISDLTVNEQTPLFLATTLGTNAQAYWAAQVGGSGSWASYLSGNDYEDYINSLLWDLAAMNGALAGYGATIEGLIEPTTNKVSTNMISALTGALTVTAGKLMFGWVPRIVKPLQLNVQNIANINNNGNPYGPNPFADYCIPTVSVATAGGVGGPVLVLHNTNMSVPAPQPLSFAYHLVGYSPNYQKVCDY